MRGKNNELIFKVIILTAFTSLLLYLLFTKRIMEYVHPRLIPFIVVSSIIMIISIIILLLTNTLNTNRRVRLTSYLIYIVPLVLFIVVDVNNIEVKNNVIDYTSNIEDTEYINGDNFKDFLKNADSYLNNTVEISGFYHIDEKKNEFISRNFMACCAADMQIVGIECNYPKETNLSEGTWIKVKGIIKIENGKYIIEALDVNIDNNPDKKYIY